MFYQWFAGHRIKFNYNIKSIVVERDPVPGRHRLHVQVVTQLHQLFGKILGGKGVSLGNEHEGRFFFFPLSSRLPPQLTRA